jgi:hypothetical protein
MHVAVGYARALSASASHVNNLLAAVITRSWYACGAIGL